MALVGTKKPPQGGFFVSGVEIICLVIYPNGGKRKMFMTAAVDYLAPRRDILAETESGPRLFTASSFIAGIWGSVFWRVPWRASV